MSRIKEIILRQTWTTKDEIEFISKLGMNNPEQRKTKLLRYLKALETRTRWGSINREDVIDFISREIQREIQTCGREGKTSCFAHAAATKN